MKNIFYILIVFVLFSCSEDDITPSDPANLHGIDRTTELGESTYDVYEKYGSIIRYKYEREQYTYGIGTYYNITFVENKDPQVLATSVDFANTFLLELFDEDFMKRYSPRNIYLCDTIKRTNRWFTSYYDEYVGYNYIAFSGFNTDWLELNDAQIQAKQKEIKLLFVVEYLVKQKYISIPEKFSEVSYKHYGDWNIRDNFMEYGFWQIGWSVPRLIEEDFGHYLERIQTTSHEDIINQIEGYPLMEKKYTVVREWLHDNNINL